MRTTIKPQIQANFLVEDLGKFVFEEYERKVELDYKQNIFLKRLRYDEKDRVIKGSNPFAVVLVNQILHEIQLIEGARVATPRDLEIVFSTNALDLLQFFTDTALILRSYTDSEKTRYLARNLYHQVKARGKRASHKNPVLIPLSNLELENDSDSRHGLVFKLTERAEVIEAPQLVCKNNHKNFSRTDKNGLPIFDENGERDYYTGGKGISRFGTDGLMQGSCSGGGDSTWFAYSAQHGRIVMVRDTPIQTKK